MPLYLNTQGKRTLGIGLCDRCRRKFPIDELLPDPNSPGLRVCEADRDQLDPYRLPARQPERVTLRFVRPDLPLATDPSGLIAENGDQFITNQDGDGYLKP